MAYDRGKNPADHKQSRTAQNEESEFRQDSQRYLKGPLKQAIRYFRYVSWTSSVILIFLNENICKLFVQFDVMLTIIRRAKAIVSGRESTFK